MNYRDLEVWQLTRELVIAVHEMTLSKLPKFEAFEEGRQIRRSIKSVKSCIVEGYGRRRYKQEFVRFLTMPWLPAMRLRTTSRTLIATKSLKDAAMIEALSSKLDELGRKLNVFLQSIERSHLSEK